MNQKLPMVRNINWLMFAIQMLIVAGFTILLSILLYPILGSGLISFLLLPIVLYVLIAQRIMLRHHRAGIRQLRQGNYESALQAFEQSFEFYTAHPGLDRMRYVLLVTASRFTLREMAMMNIAYCFAQMGDKEKTLKYYQRLLREYPENFIAQNTLRFIEMIEND
ncbi:MAG: tetratricopeptide repeat protein [Anaerolineae bacterium]|nr:tetratricopeptide repeat protein [Anaerolineae bacterium]